jgi:thioredoxin 1
LGIPVIKYFCEGKEVGEIVGYIPQDTLRKEIEKISRNTPNCLANTSLRK